MKKTMAVLVALVAALTVLVPQGDAEAQTRRRADPSYDVRDNQVGQLPGWLADIERVRVTHGKHRIFVRVDFHWMTHGYTNANRWGKPFNYVQVALQTDTVGFSRDYTMKRRFRGPNTGAHRTGVYKVGRPDLANYSGPKRTCGLRSTVNWKRDFVTMSAPRRCFGNPRWVRATAEFYGRYVVPGWTTMVVWDDMRGMTRRAYRG